MSISRRRTRSSEEALNDRLADLETITDRSDLVRLWQQVHDRPPPRNISQGLMKLAIAYRLQEKIHGGLRPACAAHLAGLMTSSPKPLPDGPKPGTRLIRQWHGRCYEAVITENGVIMNGLPYRSLSEAARTITGSRWSGPRFFGLQKARGS